MAWRRGGVALIALALACAGTPVPANDAERQAVRTSVDSATRALAAAERALDIERTIAHLAPEFYMYNDGVRTGYDSAVASIRRSLPAFASFAPVWTNLEVLVLSREAAVATFTFRDSIVMRTGDVLRLWGPTTLVWERRGRDWLITYADADHYPLAPP
ncbi:MAG: nuclear transport factor 2 family protein [Gemmatimonadota bacterium]|nr:nuclear transport factor 2 family protein [Gemmatimonadota bacterium]